MGTRKPRRLEDAAVGGEYVAWVIEDPLKDNRIYGVMFLDGAWTIDSMLATFAPHRENP